jgi:hypothetical protein
VSSRHHEPPATKPKCIQTSMLNQSLGRVALDKGRAESDRNLKFLYRIQHKYLHTFIERQNLYHPLQNYREAWYENNGPNKLFTI